MSTVGHLATVALVLLVASGAASFRSETTNAFFSDTELALARYIADVPTGSCAALWADEPASSALKITGSDHIFYGCVHSNGGFDLMGARDVFHRSVRHVGTYNNNSNGHIMRGGVLNVAHDVYPYPYQVSDYSPTGCKARQAANSGAYFSYVGSTIQLKGPLIREGLHYVDGNANVDLTAFVGNITVVSTGKIDMAAGPLGARSYVDQLIAHAGASGPNALKFTGNGGTVRGVMHAPYGEVSFSAQDNDYYGQIMGWRVTVSGSESEFRISAPVGYQPCS